MGGETGDRRTDATPPYGPVRKCDGMANGLEIKGCSMTQCVGDPACPFPPISDGCCRRHWEVLHPVDRYAAIDALRAQYLARSKAKGGAASDYRPRDKDNKPRGKGRRMTENDKADHIALVNLIAEETVKMDLQGTTSGIGYQSTLDLSNRTLAPSGEILRSE